ncbi:MAG: OmpH family outer membrane protein [Clostridia bacterium]|nr:OmpH family outer membrane protein [Clostridia bacterium]
MIRKTVAVLAAALLCAALSSPAQAAGKIGVLNPVRVSTQSDPGKEADRQIEASLGRERKQLEQQQADFDKQVKDFENQAPALSDKARAERQGKLQKTFQDIQTRGTAFAQRAQRLQRDIDAQMKEVVSAACKAFAEKNGYDLIITTQAVPYATASYDVTEGVIQEVNRAWKSRGGKYKISSK